MYDSNSFGDCVRAHITQLQGLYRRHPAARIGTLLIITDYNPITTRICARVRFGGGGAVGLVIVVAWPLINHLVLLAAGFRRSNFDFRSVGASAAGAQADDDGDGRSMRRCRRCRCRRRRRRSSSQPTSAWSR